MNSIIIWDEKEGHKTPRSCFYDDIYFNSEGAVAESSYVFIEGNQLSTRFLSHPRDTFIVAETGFGSGLNFLLLWHAFLAFKALHPDHILQKLKFYSIEKYPLSNMDLSQIYRQLQQEGETIKPLIAQLQQHWPSESLQFPDVSVEVLFDDITAFPSFLDKQLSNLDKDNQQIDAWFFDGFSPSKNPEMWSETLFRACYQLTHQDGTFATFTAAGAVRRNLQNAGFLVSKRKGFGVKREMLIGIKSKLFFRFRTPFDR